MFKCFLLCLAIWHCNAATVIYHPRPHPHQGTSVLSSYPLHQVQAVQSPQAHPHPGYTIVAPLTKIAHVTYDSVPLSHTPFEHVPLFQRIGHVKNIRL